MREIFDLSYSHVSDICKLDLYLPEADTYPTIVFFHGGGMETGSRKGLCETEIARTYLRSGIGYAIVEYRMYTHGAKYPDFLDDAKAAVDFVADYMKNIGNNGPLLVAGASAGAWLGLMLCLNPSYKPNAPIAGWLIESPQTTSHFNIIKYEMGLDPRMERINEYAPLYFVDPDTVFSKMLLIVYDNDLPCRYEENMLFIKHIKRFNPQADLEHLLLSGSHCQGSCKKNEDGQYPIVPITLDWMRRKELLK